MSLIALHHDLDKGIDAESRVGTLLRLNLRQESEWSTSTKLSNREDLNKQNEAWWFWGEQNNTFAVSGRCFNLTEDSKLISELLKLAGMAKIFYRNILMIFRVSAWNQYISEHLWAAALSVPRVKAIDIQPILSPGVKSPDWSFKLIILDLPKQP